MPKSRAEQLLETMGQSVWLDYIRRGQLDSGEFTACTTSYATGVLAQGTHTLTVIATDAAGNHHIDQRHGHRHRSERADGAVGHIRRSDADCLRLS